MNDNARKHSGWLAPILLFLSLILMGIAPAFLSGGYNLMRHSVSESAAQQLHNGWIARLGFLAAGLGAILLAGQMFPRWGWLERMCCTAFGAMFFVVAVLDHRPWLPDVPVNERADLVHSIGATLMGLAITILLTVVIWRRRYFSDMRAWWDRFVLLIVILVPLGMNFVASLVGGMQRFMFLTTFVWLIGEWFARNRVFGRSIE